MLQVQEIEGGYLTLVGTEINQWGTPVSLLTEERMDSVKRLLLDPDTEHFRRVHTHGRHWKYFVKKFGQDEYQIKFDEYGKIQRYPSSKKKRKRVR